MIDFISYSNISIGILLSFFALIITANGIPSKILFKVSPFFSGLILIFNGLKLLGII